MLEPSVTITDYILAVQCLYYTINIRYKVLSSSNIWWVVLFSGMGLGAFCGGTVHGFFPDESSLYYKILWKLTLISVGFTILACWHISVYYIIGDAAQKWIKRLAIVQFFIFNIVIIFYSQDFFILVMNYFPAIIVMLVVFVYKYYATSLQCFLFGIGSVILTFVGSFIQVSKISLHVDFNHNALYHVVQMVSIWLLYVMIIKYNIYMNKKTDNI